MDLRDGAGDLGRDPLADGGHGDGLLGDGIAGRHVEACGHGQRKTANEQGQPAGGGTRLLNVCAWLHDVVDDL